MDKKTNAKDLLDVVEKTGEKSPDYPSRRDSKRTHLTLGDVSKAFSSKSSAKSIISTSSTRRSSRHMSSSKKCSSASSKGRRHSRRVSSSPSSRSKSPHHHKSHKSHKKRHHNVESVHNMKFKDIEAAEDGKADGNGDTKSTFNFKLWGGIAFMLLLTIVGVVGFIMFSSTDNVQISDYILHAYDIDDADKYNPDAWINALKEMPQRQYTLDLIPACRIAVSLMNKQPEDPNFEKKMSILYHILAHIYYFTYSGRGIDANWVRRQSKYGDLLMKVFEDWSTACPNVKNPWEYKKCILKASQDMEYNMSDYSVRNRETQIEQATVMMQECTKEYKFLETNDRSDYEW